MKTEINWIKYEGKTDNLERGEYFVYGACIKGGEIIKEMRRANFRIDKMIGSGGTLLDKKRMWDDLDSFIIEYYTPLSAIEEGITEALKQE